MRTKKRISFLSESRTLHLFIIIGILLLSLQYNLKAQSTIQKEDVLVVADEMPSFPGGPKALMDIVYKSITYPEDAKEKGIEGKVTVRFIIDKEGKAVQPSITKGLCPSIDKAVIEVITKIPKFIPGKMAGQPVNVWYALPINFRLEK